MEESAGGGKMIAAAPDEVPTVDRIQPAFMLQLFVHPEGIEVDGFTANPEKEDRHGTDRTPL